MTRSRDRELAHLADGFIDVRSHAAEGLTTESLSAAKPLLAQGITTIVVTPDGGGAVDLTAQQDSLLEHGLGVNVEQLVPRGATREEVMGMSNRDPSADELSEMKALVREEMEAGGLGLSSGPCHAPGSCAETEAYGALYASLRLDSHAPSDRSGGDQKLR